MTSSLSSTTPTRAAVLPRRCTFTVTDWLALAPFWYPVAFSNEAVHTPYAATLLDSFTPAGADIAESCCSGESGRVLRLNNAFINSAVTARRGRCADFLELAERGGFEPPVGVLAPTTV